MLPRMSEYDGGIPRTPGTRVQRECPGESTHGVYEIVGRDVEHVILVGPLPRQRELYVEQDTFDSEWEEV